MDRVSKMIELPPKTVQRTAATLGSRTVRIICQRLLQPTGRFRRRSLSLNACRRKEEPKRRRQALRMSLAFVRSGPMSPRPTRPGRRATVRSGGAPGRSDLIRLAYEAPFAAKPGGWSRPGHAFRAIGAAAARRLIRSVSQRQRTLCHRTRFHFSPANYESG